MARIITMSLSLVITMLSLQLSVVTSSQWLSEANDHSIRRFTRQLYVKAMDAAWTHANHRYNNDKSGGGC
jgi:hypothetical protein